MTAVVYRLFDLAETLETCAPLAADDARTLAAMVRAAIAGEPIEHALGIERGPGQRTLATTAALAARDLALREAGRFYPGPPSAQAEALARDLRHYAASGWLYERTHDTCPARHKDKKGELLWRVLKARDYVLTPRAIRSILARS